jgi:O-glycosyl hydrolase
MVVLFISLAAGLARAQTVAINYAAPQQTIRGFGGATAWLGELTVPQADALFSPTGGLGLSMLRVRIDPTGTAASGWVPSNGGWLTEVENAQEAVAANPNAIVFASPWTPPASLKASSSSQPYYSGTCSPAAGYCGGYLNPANYATYAAYLEDFVTYFNTNAGFNLYAISMQNEPDFANVDYESCNWTAAQMDAWVAGNASVLTTKLIMPESFQFIQAQALTALDDPGAEPLISIIGGHLYGASPAPYPLAEQDGKDIWMTEHYITPAGSQPVITDALTLAEEVNSSMVTGNYNAYVWWWIWDNPAESINFGLINSSTTSPVPTYYGYALGQFSKFIQPGYVMASSTEPIPGVFDSAYMGGGNLVIVAINSNTTATAFPVSIAGQIASSFTPYQTSATETMAQLTPVSVTNDSFTYSLPAQSITTFVGAASTTPGFTIEPATPSLSLGQGKSATETITVSRLNGFSGSVTLAVAGLPSGVTGTFGANPATGNSVLTLTASSTATTGAATVTVTGTSGTITESTTFSLFIGSSACNVVYTISPQSSNAFGGAITINNTGTSAITSWTLGWTFANGQTISSLWNGVETQTGANVTVTNESYNGTIAAGGSMSQVGFNGTWNGVTNSIPAAFTLNGVTCTSGVLTSGGFTLAASAATLSIGQGASAMDTISVTDVSPFAGSVTLAASGLPAGVSAAFGTNPTTGSSIVTLTASATAMAGTSTVTITGASGTLSGSTTIVLTVTGGSTGSFTLQPSSATLSVAQGASSTDTITVTDVSPFAGSVALVASGLPAGVIASFEPSTTTSTSVLTLTASSAASCAGATGTVTITGVSGSLTATTTIALAVPATSCFTLAASPTALSIDAGGSGTDTITIADAAGFAGNVTLAASGLPAGVTAAFGTNPTTGSSVLTLTASSTATVGTSTITITGTSGSLTATTGIALTVAASNGFTLAPSAATLSVAQGASGTDTLSVQYLGTLSYPISLVASGLPSGVTAAFATNPTSATSVLTLAASSTAVAGSYTVTITGTATTSVSGFSAPPTATATITLTVTSTGPAAGCHVVYTIAPQNSSAFGAAISIQNTGASAINNWTLTWTFANGQTISSLWNGIESQSGANVTVTNEPYNGTIAAGATLTGIGFNGTWNGSANAVPASFAVNGTTCK